jgi:hypothetical protein
VAIRKLAMNIPAVDRAIDIYGALSGHSEAPGVRAQLSQHLDQLHSEGRPIITALRCMASRSFGRTIFSATASRAVWLAASAMIYGASLSQSERAPCRSPIS